jgi:hypothetical protein
MLDAIEMHLEFIRHLLQRPALTQQPNTLRSPPRAGMWMVNAHVQQRLVLLIRQFQSFHRCKSPCFPASLL